MKNEVINKFSLAEDKFIHEMHLREPWFTYGVCGPFTKTKNECKNLKKWDIQDVFIKMI